MVLASDGPKSLQLTGWQLTSGSGGFKTLKELSVQDGRDCEFEFCALKKNAKTKQQVAKKTEKLFNDIFLEKNEYKTY